MAERWEDVEELLVATAGDDLEITDDVTPALVAYCGEELLFVAWVRPFAKGHHHEPVLEVCSLAAVLGADRLAMSFGARVWSLDDPVPPVAPEGDLRQRAVTVHMVDATVQPASAMHALHPFDMRDGVVAWGSRLAHQDVEGWIPETLVRVAGCSPTAARGEAEALLVLQWLTDLGHDVHLGVGVGQRLDAAASS